MLAPQLRSIVATPVAPRFSALRSLVLPDTAHVRLVNRSPETTVLTVDGDLQRPIKPVASVDIAIAEETCLFARRGPRSAVLPGSGGETKG